MMLLSSTTPGLANDRLGPTCQQFDYYTVEVLSTFGPGACQEDAGVPGDAEDRCYAATRALPIESDSFISGRLVPPEDTVDAYLLTVPDPAPARILLSLFEPSPSSNTGFPNLRLSVWNPCNTFITGAPAREGGAEVFLENPAPGVYGVVVSMRYEADWYPPSASLSHGVYFEGVCKPSCRDEAQQGAHTMEQIIEQLILEAVENIDAPRQLVDGMIRSLTSIFRVQVADPVTYKLSAEDPDA